MHFKKGNKKFIKIGSKEKVSKKKQLWEISINKNNKRHIKLRPEISLFRFMPEIENFGIFFND